MRPRFFYALSKPRFLIDPSKHRDKLSLDLRISRIRFMRSLLITITLAILAPLAFGQSISSRSHSPFKKHKYPWKMNITATIFWVGESPSGRNKTHNHSSSWDTHWAKNFGGFDDPDPSARHKHYFRPKAFKPKQNPFYIALPYNDRIDWRKHKPEASKVIPWFKKYNPKPGKTVCKGRWLQIVYNKKVCYAQWEDCGPWTTDDWRYVFGNRKPKNKHNNGAGIDVSPAVRDYLGMKSGDKLHWRFIDFEDVPKGPWARYGDNNPFVNPEMDRDLVTKRAYMEYLRKRRDDG